MKMRSTSSSLAIVVALIGGLALTVSASQWQSRCSAERDLQMDVCASKMGFLGDHSFLVPKNLTAMNKFCTNLKQSINCIQSYTRDCLNGFTRQLLTSLLRRGKQQYNSICNDDNSRAEFLKKMSCMSDDKIDTFHGCMDASIGRFEYIASDKVNQESKLQSLCCSYQIFNRDVDSTLDKICGKPVDRKSSINQYVQRIVGGTAGEFFSLICDGHRSLEDCKASRKTSSVLPKLEETTRLVTERKLKPKNKSLVPVLLEILDSSRN